MPKLPPKHSRRSLLLQLPAFLLFTVATATSCVRVGGRQTAAPDVIYVNAKVWTGDDARPEAQAFAVKGDRLVAVGTTPAMRALAAASTTVIDLGGRRVVPGFNDSHWHLPARAQADLADAGSVAELQKRMRAYAQSLAPASWLLGRGWTASDFPDNQPHRKYLDELFPDRPVLLRDRDGHQALVNSKALELSGITRSTPDPERGQIDHDGDGELTGVFKESAASLVSKMVPAVSAADVASALEAEMTKAASFGLTSLQEASAGEPSGATFDAMQQAVARGTMRVRFRVSVPFAHDVTPEQIARYVAVRDAARSSLLSYGIAKGMLDGTVDAKTAAMLEPYVGGGTGLSFWNATALNAAVAAYDKAGVQIELHAIGDAAVRMALDAYEQAAMTNGTSGRRHRIEHVEVPALADLPRFKQLGVIASTQPIFASPDATTLQNYAPLLGPARASHSNAFKLFDDAGATQAFGSDYPVFPMDVLRGIATAVTRTMPDGTPNGGWYPEHRISVVAALKHFTRDAAYASFSEKDKGTIAVGKYADFVVLSDDVLAVAPAQLFKTTVLLTVMGGRETWRDPSFR